MTNLDRELWPATWKETKAQAASIIRSLGAKTVEQPLGAEEILQLNNTISHLRFAWNRSWRNPLLGLGAAVIREHFSKVFSLESTRRPQDQYRRILDRTIPAGYFENKDRSDPELRAMATLMTYHNSRRRKQLDLDFTGLVI